MLERTVRTQEKRQSLFFIILLLGVIFFRIIYMIRTSGPFIYADEFGYWSHAAHMAGYNWVGAMEGVGWYSFGYSFWLALTFLFSHHMAVMYRLAICLNVLMSVGIYILAYRIVRKLAKEQTRDICALIAFAATCFPTYLYYSYTTMCETLLAFVIWLLFYEVISLEEAPVWWKGILLGATTGYAYMVHNRLLTTVLAVSVCVLVLWILHRIDGRTVLSYALSAAVMLAIYVLVKGFLQSIIVETRVAAGTQMEFALSKANTFSGIWEKFRTIFTPERIVRPFVSLMGQVWQILSSTYLMAGVGAVCAIACLRRGSRQEGKISPYLYALLSLLFSVGLTCVVAYGPEPGAAGRVRMDPAFYGRYNEVYYPLLIMIALIMLCESEFRSMLKTGLGVALLYLLLSVGMYFRLYGLDGYLNIVSAVSIHIFHWLGEFSVWKCCAIALIGGAAVGLCCLKRDVRLVRYAGILALAFLFTMTAVYCMRTTIRGENDYTMQYEALFDYLNENTAEGEKVYITVEGKPMYDLQSRLVDQSVIYLEMERLKNIPRGAYAVVESETLPTLELSDYETCLEKKGYAVIKVGEE